MKFEYILTVFITIVTVVDPLGLVPVYIPLASRFSRAQRRQLILYSCLIAFAIAAGFLIGGKFLFHYLEVNFNALYIVGGVLLFLIGLDMIYTRPKRVNVADEENKEVVNLKDVAVFPLAIPMLSGPGTIATVVMFSSRHDTPENYVIILGAVAVSFLLCAITMTFSNAIFKLLGRTGINVLDRVIGIILCSLAVQFVINAVTNIVRAVG
jgi:multiple antibiotic resistance protein